MLAVLGMIAIGIAALLFASWVESKKEKKHEHEFKNTMVGRATITHSYFGGKWESQQEVIATMQVCSCGEKKAFIEDLSGHKREINPFFLDMDYRNGVSMCASGVHTCES